MIKINEIKALNSFISSTKPLEDHSFAQITIDNRNIVDENLFIAFVGERYNPLDDLEVLKDKIKYVVYDNHNADINSYLDNFIFIKVTDTLKFSQEVASKIAIEFNKANTLIGIAGSNGKTTTKEMLSHALGALGINYTSTQKNNNNHLGVPLTLFQIREETRVAVVELGSNHPGEMDVLMKIISPQFGVTTNIGETHLEFFDSLKDVYLEESTILRKIRESKYFNKKFYKNNDDQYLKNNDDDFIISFGYSGADFKFVDDNNAITIEETKTSKSYTLENNKITGKHNRFNLALSFVILKTLMGIDSEALIIALNSFAPTPNRGEWFEYGGAQIFLDAYNANPSSMLSAVRGFKESIGNNESEALLILGDMNELGELTNELHEKVSKECAALGFINQVFIGQYHKAYKAGFDDGKIFDSAESYAKSSFQDDIKKYKSIFIKGSRSLQLESIFAIK